MMLRLFGLYFYKGGIFMNCNDANKSIGCTVEKCAHHCHSENYCTLNQVSIGSHETDPKVCQCVDCESFVPRS